MDRQEIIRQLKAFPYDPGEYWVITGSAMALYGIREQTHDIDLGCTAGMADALEKDGVPYRRTPDGKRKFRYGEDIEIFEEWLCGSLETVDGFQVISPDGLIAMKQALGREKDRRDIEMIRAYMRHAKQD